MAKLKIFNVWHENEGAKNRFNERIVISCNEYKANLGGDGPRDGDNPGYHVGEFHQRSLYWSNYSGSRTPLPQEILQCNIAYGRTVSDGNDTIPELITQLVEECRLTDGMKSFLQI